MHMPQQDKAVTGNRLFPPWRIYRLIGSLARARAMPNFRPRHLLVALASVLVADAFSIEAPSSPLTGVRISLYPKTGAGQSLKQTIKDAVAGISDLGVAVRPDDVSSALIGPEPALFEATRAIFGRACRAEGEPHVSMICSFFAGCPPAGGGAFEESVIPPPERTVPVPEDEWIDDAKLLPKRVACQFSVYPMGSASYVDTISAVMDEVRKSPAFKDELQGIFCTTLDGDGEEVFNVLRSSFELTRKKHLESGAGEHVSMHVTITANKSAWKK